MRCQEFLTKLLERAGQTGGDQAVHTNIVDLFDAVLLQQGFVTQWSDSYHYIVSQYCQRQEKF